MIETHDFANNTTWANGTDDSKFVLAPLPGYKLYVTSVVVRFPENIDLSSNGVIFKVYKSYDGVNPVTDQHFPVITKEYNSLVDLMRTSNNPFSEFSTESTVFTNSIVEVKFRYSDSDQSDFSKLVLSSKLNEYITMENIAHTPLINVEGQPISDVCYAFFNTKRVVDF